MKTLKLTSNGLTGKSWTQELESKGCNVGMYAKQLLLSPDFKCSKKGTEYDIVIYDLEDLTDKDYITTKEVREKAQALGCKTPNAEIACLIRENMSDKEIKDMGMRYITVMHEPIEDSVRDPDLLCVNRNDDGRWLGTARDSSDFRWFRGAGFVFLAPQVGAQSSALGTSSEPQTLTLESRVNALEELAERMIKALTIKE